MMEKNCKHLIDHRPWGHYEILLKEPTYQVKRIEVNPGHRLSLQKHMKRLEEWVIVQGVGIVTVGDEERKIKRGSLVTINTGVLHRVANTGKEPLVFIETQEGDYLEEDDIIRIEDDYRRI